MLHLLELLLLVHCIYLTVLVISYVTFQLHILTLWFYSTERVWQAQAEGQRAQGLQVLTCKIPQKKKNKMLEIRRKMTTNRSKKTQSDATCPKRDTKRDKTTTNTHNKAKTAQRCETSTKTLSVCIWTYLMVHNSHVFLVIYIHSGCCPCFCCVFLNTLIVTVCKDIERHWFLVWENTQ